MHKKLEDIIGAMLLLSMVAFAGGWIVKDYNSRISVYNEHMCATYGLEADCSTPLAQNN